MVMAASILALASVETPDAQAKQQCSAEIPSSKHGYWSYRLIDGRKCWYEGKPMLSKSLLEWLKQEWPKQASAQLVLTNRSNDPLNSQASTDTESFEARWRDRVGF